MRVDDPPAGEAREADVREGREREARVAHPAEGLERDRRPRAVVRPDRRDVERGEPARGDRRADAARDLGLVVERQQRDDRKRGDAAHRLDRDDELLEVEEGLDHEQVDAASLEHLRLRRVLRTVLGRIEHLELAERADRPGDEDVAPGDLARLAREPHGGGVDLLERLVEEHPGELAAVRAERVRLDQLGPGGDVARVDGDDALGRTEVRLLRAAEAGHGLRDQRPRPAVGHDGRAAAESFEEPAHVSTLVPACRGDRAKRGCRRAPLRHDRSPTLEPAPLAPERRPVSEAVIGGRAGPAYHPSGVPGASVCSPETERGRPSPPRSPLHRPWK